MTHRLMLLPLVAKLWRSVCGPTHLVDLRGLCRIDDAMELPGADRLHRVLSRGRVEQSRDLIPAQHNGQVARMQHPDQFARHVKPVDRVREEEPERRRDAVHGRRRHTGIALLDPELAHVICRRCVG